MLTGKLNIDAFCGLIGTKNRWASYWTKTDEEKTQTNYRISPQTYEEGKIEGPSRD